ncbi:MAG: GMC family oxidoreductase, partial [Proteobacteria bacterium]|nr:GMC family oxidoreductase [Pseudomonadota bacterium]
PVILRESGLRNVAKNGFHCDPGFALFGKIPGLNGSETFLGSVSSDYKDDIALGDVSLSRTFYNMTMLASLKLTRLFSYSESIGIGVKLKDKPGGELRNDGKFYKEFSSEETEKMKKGEEQALKILKQAGAKSIFRGAYGAAGVGGVIDIQKDLDKNLQTEIQNLHVCDGSIIPGEIRVAPTLTLICLGKYLAKRL